MKNVIILLGLISVGFAQTHSFFLSARGPFEALTCSEIWVKNPPFHITSNFGMGRKTYENFRSRRNHNQREAYIPKRSIVRVARQSADFVNHPQAYVPVEVIGVNQSEEHLRQADNLGRDSSAASGLRRVNMGQKGFIHTKSLDREGERAGDLVFLVKEDSPIIDDHNLSAMGVVAIKPVSMGDKYLVKNCCSGQRDFGMNLDQNLENNQNCSQEYQFQLVHANGGAGRRIGLSDSQICRSADSLVPLPANITDDFEALHNFLTLSSEDPELNFTLDDLQLVESRGYVKIPLDHENFDGSGARGPYGSYHYSMDGGGEDSLAQPVSACAFMQVLKEHDQRCQEEGCQAQFGDFLYENSWGNAHKSHGNGDCVDIRPFKTRHNQHGLDYCSSKRGRGCDRLNPLYDRDKTQAFINLLHEAGASNVYFNDSQIQGADWMDAHDNHIHACFNPDDGNVMSACRDGLR